MNKLDTEKAEQCLLSLSEVLAQNGFAPSWERKLRSIAEKKNLAPEDFRSQVKLLFGGMGSLNDLIVYSSDGRIDPETNELFDHLRRELFSSVQ